MLMLGLEVGMERVPGNKSGGGTQQLLVGGDGERAPGVPDGAGCCSRIIGHSND